MSTLWVRHASSSAAVARRSVLEAFDAAGLTTEQALDAALIASELVGNAVRHAAPLPSGQLAVSWLVDSDGYEISVTDGGVPGATRSAISARQAGGRDADGRGLRIVAELSDDWGVAAQAGATTVWARTGTPGLNHPGLNQPY
jgi:anti-sigma regulatory factor (Ser/Thr protein kinase)